MHLSHKHRSAYTRIIHYSPTLGKIPDDQSSCILEEATPREDVHWSTMKSTRQGKRTLSVFFSSFFPFFFFFFFSFFLRTKEARRIISARTIHLLVEQNPEIDWSARETSPPQTFHRVRKKGGRHQKVVVASLPLPATSYESSKKLELATLVGAD